MQNTANIAWHCFVLILMKFSAFKHFPNVILLPVYNSARGTKHYQQHKLALTTNVDERRVECVENVKCVPN